MTTATALTTAQLAAAETVGRRWQKNAMDRIYVDASDFAEDAGLSVNHYGTGNVSSASWQGEDLSNARATEILSALAMTKVWLDVTTGLVQVKWGYPPREAGIYKEIVAAAGASLLEAVEQVPA